MPDERPFDGVVCFGGGDWWYHNRGHYDMQLLQRLSDHVPILFVNSIGIRVPSVREGTMFFRRVGRKLKSLSRGFQKVDETWGVISPFAIPGPWGRLVTRAVLPTQVRSAARKMGINKPLVWVTCPPAADYISAIRPAGVVYQRTDRWEEFPNADPEDINRCDRMMKDRADATLFCADLLFEEEAGGCKNAVYIDHGVDYGKFAAAGAAADTERTAGDPQELRDIKRPRVGFIGGIDSHTFDPELFLDVAKQLPDVRFYLVGACSLPTGWCELPNVSLLGRRPYEDVAAYMAAADVLIMPWKRNEWIRACNPVKLKEYLAAGRPIVTRDFYELRRYQGFVTVADSAEKFADAIRAGLLSPPEPEQLRGRVEGDTWDAKAQALLDTLSARGLHSVDRLRNT